MASAWHALWLLLALVTACDHPREPLLDWELRGRPVSLPAHLDGLSRGETYVLTTRVVLPPEERGRELDFVIPHLWANTELWVDGARAVRIGELRRGPLRTTTPHLYRIPRSATADGVLALGLHVAHRWTQSGWIDVPPRLVRAGERDLSAAHVALVNGPLALCGMATLLQIGLAALLVYAMGGRREVYLWFGIQAIAATSYPMLIYGVTQSLGPDLEVPVVASGLVIAVWASARFSYAFFGLGALPRWVDGWSALAVVGSFVGHDPYISTRVGGLAAICTVATAIVLQCVLCLRMTLVPARRNEARWYFACWLALALTCWNEQVTWAGLGEVFAGARLACAGLMAFAFFLSLLLSQRHMSALGRSDQLNTELEARVVDLTRRGTEIARLNEELRRQIAERSEQIYAALALGDRAAGKAPDLNVGDVVQGRYRVLALRGMGGMGAVYEVERLEDKAHLALKLAREGSGAALALLAREAQIAAQLHHPNLVRVIDVDIASSLGVLFVVLEFVDGESLSEQSDRFGDVAWAVSVLAQVARGLSVLHRAGIVHRDIKPANILLGAGGVKITDFGIAKLEGVHSIAPKPAFTPDTTQDDATEVLTPTPEVAARSTPRSTGGQIVGTPAYLAPELVVPGVTATPAADVYAFGVLAFELVARERPFDRPPAFALLSGAEPAPPRPLPAHVPAALRGLIVRCLALGPALRPTADELVRVLDAQTLADGGTRGNRADPRAPVAAVRASE